MCDAARGRCRPPDLTPGGGSPASGPRRPWETETTESETAGQEGPLWGAERPSVDVRRARSFAAVPVEAQPASNTVGVGAPTLRTWKTRA